MMASSYLVAKGILNVLFPITTLLYAAFRLCFPPPDRNRALFVVPLFAGIGIAFSTWGAIYLTTLLAANLSLLASVLLGFALTATFGWASRALGAFIGYSVLKCCKVSKISFTSIIRSALTFGIFGNSNADIFDALGKRKEKRERQREQKLANNMIGTFEYKQKQAEDQKKFVEDSKDSSLRSLGQLLQSRQTAPTHSNIELSHLPSQVGGPDSPSGRSQQVEFSTLAHSPSNESLDSSLTRKPQNIDQPPPLEQDPLANIEERDEEEEFDRDDPRATVFPALGLGNIN